MPRGLLRQSGVLARLHSHWHQTNGRVAPTGEFGSAGYVEGDTTNIVNVTMAPPPSQLPVNQWGDIVARRVANSLRSNLRRRPRQ